MLTPELAVACEEQKTQWKGLSGMARERGHRMQSAMWGWEPGILGFLWLTRKRRKKEKEKEGIGHGAISVLCTKDDYQFTVSRVCAGSWPRVTKEAQGSGPGPHT